MRRRRGRARAPAGRRRAGAVEEDLLADGVVSVIEAADDGVAPRLGDIVGERHNDGEIAGAHGVAVAVLESRMRAVSAATRKQRNERERGREGARRNWSTSSSRSRKGPARRYRAASTIPSPRRSRSAATSPTPTCSGRDGAWPSRPSPGTTAKYTASPTPNRTPTPTGSAARWRASYARRPQLTTTFSEFSTETWSGGVAYGLPLSETQGLSLGVSLQRLEFLTTDASSFQLWDWVRNNGSTATYATAFDLMWPINQRRVFLACCTAVVWDRKTGSRSRWCRTARSRTTKTSRAMRHAREPHSARSLPSRERPPR